MPPKKKTQEENENLMFITEMKPSLESDGHKFHGCLMDVNPVCTPLWKNLTAEPNAVYTQRAAPIMKEDDVFEVEAIRSVPRKPNSYSGIVMKTVGLRIGANFDIKPQSVIPGAGRGVLVIGAVPRFHGRRILSGASSRKLISEPIAPGPPSQESAPSITAGRGYSRLSLLIDD